MRFNNILYWVLIIFSQLSCQRDINRGTDFTEESFKENIYLKESVKYENDSLRIENPSSLRFHVDSFLVIQEMNSKRLIKIVDLKSDKVQEIIPVGKGPGEMLVPWGIDIVDNRLFIFCGQLGKVIILEPDITRCFKIVDEFRLEEKKTTQFFPLTVNRLVCLSNHGDNSRLTILDGKGKVLEKMGDYPPFLNSNITKGDNNIFQSFISGNKDNGKIIVACKTTDILEIYDINNGMEKRIQGPLGLQISIITEKVGKGIIRHPEPICFTYQNVVSNNAGFWVAYIGYKPKKGVKPSLSDMYPRKIFSFDWKGNQLKRINFDNPILSFDIDWNSMTLYTIEWVTEDPEIRIYNLHDFIK